MNFLDCFCTFWPLNSANKLVISKRGLRDKMRLLIKQLTQIEITHDAVLQIDRYQV